MRATFRKIYISSAFQKDNYTSKNTQAESASRRQSMSDSWHVLYCDKSILQSLQFLLSVSRTSTSSLISTPERMLQGMLQGMLQLFKL